MDRLQRGLIQHLPTTSKKAKKKKRKGRKKRKDLEEER